MSKINYQKLIDADLEEVICFATLVATGTLPISATLEDVNQYWKRIEHCDFCPCVEKCLAVIINE